MSISGVWEQQSVWSQAADRLKRSIGRARALVLALAVLAAVTATASAETMAPFPVAGKVLAFLAAAAAGATPFAARGAASERVQDWTRLRAVSESVKCESYLFLAGVGPYRAERPAAVLADRIGRLRSDAADLVRYTVGLSARTRELPAVHDLDSYASQRLRAQIDGYYRPRAALMHRRAENLRRTETALGLLAALLAAAGGAFELSWAAGWVAVGASITLAVTAHGAAAKYDYQQLEFSRTAEELERLHGQWATGDIDTPEAVDSFVGRCEDIISVQNDAWMVKLAES